MNEWIRIGGGIVFFCDFLKPQREDLKENLNKNGQKNDLLIWIKPINTISAGTTLWEQLRDIVGRVLSQAPKTCDRDPVSEFSAVLLIFVCLIDNLDQQ